MQRHSNCYEFKCYHQYRNEIGKEDRVKIEL